MVLPYGPRPVRCCRQEQRRRRADRYFAASPGTPGGRRVHRYTRSRGRGSVPEWRAARGAWWYRHRAAKLSWRFGMAIRGRPQEIQASPGSPLHEMRPGTIHAHAMSEVGFRMGGDVGFEFLPFPHRVADLFAGATNPEEPSHLGELAFARFVSGALGLDASGDIDATADIAAKRAVTVMKRNTAVEDPPIGAVRAFEAVIHLEDLAAGEGTEVDAEAVFEVIGVDAFRPLIPDFLLHGTAPKQQPTVIEIIAFGTGVGTPDHNGRLFHQDLVFVCRERSCHRFDDSVGKC